MLRNLTPEERKLLSLVKSAWANVTRLTSEATRRFSLWRTKSTFITSTWISKKAKVVELAIWLLVGLIAIYLFPEIQDWVRRRVDKPAMEDLQAVVLAVGSAMIGATAIASSFVLFAMQVNIERLPYGLFHRFSSDRRLLAVFGLSFFVAVGGTALSLISQPEQAALLILLEFAAVILVLRLLLLAYRRSFQLVSPLEQLNILYQETRKRLTGFQRHLSLVSRNSDEPTDENIDTERRALLDANEGWDQQLRDSIESSVAFARRAGTRGDFQISATALKTVIALNLLYIETKGKTFFSNNLLVDNPLVTDGTINQTLEAIRRLQESALARGDEVQIEQLFSTLATLSTVYMQIDYGPTQSKSHALLAVGYLERSVEATVPRNLVDCTMHGVRVLGRVGKQFVAQGCPNEATSCISRISVLGLVGTASQKHQPVTLAVMEELRDFTILLIRSAENDIRFAVKEVRDSSQQIASNLLKVPDNPLLAMHSSYLAPYYSSTSYTSLRSLLTNLYNAASASEDADIVRRIIINISVWGDGLYRECKEILLLAIEKKSHFAFDVIHWITGITELLMAFANLEECPASTKVDIQKHALWLFSSLTWIPREKEASIFVENLSLRSEVFETALRAMRDGWDDGFNAAWKFSLDWAISAGRHQNGWGILDRWLSALAAISLWNGSDLGEKLKAELIARLAADDSPPQEIRDASASRLRSIAETLRTNELEMDIVRRILAQNDRQKTQSLLHELADILSPGTAGETVDLGFI